MADINDRLDRLQRREEFDRFGRPLRPTPPENPVGSVVARPAGVDDRLGEVLDAVAGVVRRHAGLSVMVALADGRAGRPVIRVTERDGSVETGVVVVGPSADRRDPEVTSAVLRPPELERAAPPARESVPGSDPVFEPAFRDSLPSRSALIAGAAPVTPGPVTPGPVTPGPVTPGPGTPGPGTPAAGAPVANGRHAAGGDDEVGPGRAAPASWHDALWSRAGRDRFQPAGTDEDDEGQGTNPTIPIPEDTSQVVSRLAQMLRDNPTLAANWSREAQE